MKTFDEYWEQYGELHASMCNGNIKQFAKEIWKSAIGNTEELQTIIDNLKFDMEPKWKAHSKLVKCGKCGRRFYHQKKGA
jgi:hypothetical protein